MLVEEMDMSVQDRERGETVIRTIYMERQPDMKAYASRFLFDQEGSEDVVQDVFADLWDRRESLNVQDWNAYLLRAIKFKSLNHNRRLNHDLQDIDACLAIKSEIGSPEDVVSLQEVNKEIESALGSLPGACKRIFIMSREGGMAHAEIAEQLGISVRTVKNQISKALSRIRNSVTIECV